RPPSELRKSEGEAWVRRLVDRFACRQGFELLGVERIESNLPYRSRSEGFRLKQPLDVLSFRLLSVAFQAVENALQEDGNGREALLAIHEFQLVNAGHVVACEANYAAE